MALKSGRKLNLIVSTILLALFLYLAFRNANLSELAGVLRTTDYTFVFIGIFIGVVLGTVVRSFRWRVLLEPIKPGIKFQSLFAATSIGYMVNNLIPRSGEVVRPYLLGKNENISKASAFGTIIIERIIDTMTFLLMFGLALLYFKDRISNAIPQIGSAVILLAAVIFLMLVLILLAMFRTELILKIVRFFMKVLPKRLHERIEKIFNSLVFSFNILRKPNLLLKIAFYSALLWLVYLMSTFIPFYSFGIFSDGSASPLKTLWNANLLLVLINVAMFIPSPAATGPYHYICKVTLVSIFSVNEAKALGYATSTHLMSFLIFLVVGLYYFIRYHYKISELKEETA